MFIEKGYPPPLEFRRNGIEDLTYRPYQINAMNAPNQRYECHLGIPRMAFSGTKEQCSCLWILTFSKSQYQKTLKTE
ncbi:MAG: hypothetical protein OXI67_17820 [Candidatus Poribacteria bacterium]|nr:hypothetical protein [Candidatus Poribacteria bacterium]